MTTFQLVGGFGNQLYGYFAGMHSELSLCTPCEFDKSMLPKDVGYYGEIEKAFDLSHTFIDTRNSQGQWSWMLSRLKLRLLQTGVLRNYLRERFRCDHSHGIGFDSQFKVLEGKFIARGYFQTYRYFEAVSRSSTYAPLTLRSPSKWFLGLVEIAKVEKPTIVHIRRGDYLLHNDEIGVLGPQYYEEALRQLEQNEVLGPIWVLSDDIVDAKKNFSTVMGEGATWISPPIGTSAAESLMLISKAQSVVIANSTFSWWGAILGPTNRKIVAPSKWFKNSEDPIDLVPPDWLRSESYWAV